MPLQNLQKWKMVSEISYIYIIFGFDNNPFKKPFWKLIFQKKWSHYDHNNFFDCKKNIKKGLRYQSKPFPVGMSPNVAVR